MAALHVPREHIQIQQTPVLACHAKIAPLMDTTSQDAAQHLPERAPCAQTLESTLIKTP